MRVLVTGANGFIGRAVCESLQSTGIEVVRLVRNIEAPDLENSSIVADISSKASLGLKGKRFDAVVHCAGLAHQPFGTDRMAFEATNVQGTSNVAEAAARAGVKTFVHLSSVSVYGKRSYNGPANEEASCSPFGPYAESKLESESMCRRVFEDTSTRLVILRPSTVIGEGDRGNVLRLIQSLDRGHFVMVGKGENLKSFVYIGDVAGAVVRILETKRQLKDLYNVTTSSLAVNEVVSIICDALGKKTPKFAISKNLAMTLASMASNFLPFGVFKSVESKLDTWISEDSYCGNRLAEIYTPKMTTADGLRREVRWYLDQQW